MTKIADSVALVTGGNRGLGFDIVNELLTQGASKVYATSRSPKSFDDPRVVNIVLDVNSPDAIDKLPTLAPDVTVVINNAGIISGPIIGSSMKHVRDVFETNVFGPIQIVQVLAPVLKTNGGGAIINILSALTWVPFGAYGATKAALWSAGNAVRQELAEQHTQVVGVHVGYMDTDMAKDVEAEKNDPKAVAKKIVTAIDNDESEVLADVAATHAKSLVAGKVEDLHF